MKQKTSSKKRPSAMIHMALWGGVMGWMAAWLYLSIFAPYANVFSNLSIAAMFGGVVGVILGMIDGALIHYILKGYVVSRFISVRAQAQWLVAILTTIGMGIALALMVSPVALIFFPLSFPPMLIAGASAYFATWTYFNRIDKLPPEKLKNVSRLEDKAKNEMLYKEDELEKKENVV